MRSIVSLLTTCLLFSAVSLCAWGQRPVPRILQTIRNSQRVVLAGSVHPLARPEDDQGAVSGSMRIEGMTMVFRPSAAQQAALNALLAAQRDARSGEYHQWLTPQQYGARFGMNAQDLARVETWLRAQGFTVNSVAPGLNSLTFSGTAAQVEAAFGTPLHHYLVRGRLHFANAAPVSIPAALSGVVLGVRNLNDFRPRPQQSRLQRVFAPQPRFTSSITQNHFLAPADFATIYDVTGLYNAGADGAGQKLVVLGQTEVNLSDIDAFRQAANLPANDPETILVPSTGGSVVSQNDLGEADLDIEWSGGVAKNATVMYVYVGNDQNKSVFDALSYAVQQDLAPVISISYGDCESDFGAQNGQIIQQWMQQANAQGQTLVAASGDLGAADCEGSSTNPSALITSASHGLAVDIPASVPEVTGVGGNTFNGDDGSNASLYWNSGNSAGGGSALSYIPETSWNDTSSTNGLWASGGGKSTLYAKPSWQSAPGVPQDGQRDVPDVAFAASPNHDGYLVCSGGSCVNGFRDSNQNLTVFGGTSAGAPTFAAMLTLIEQALQSNGEGNMNPVLYQLASTPSTYANVFHDITSGNNKVPCTSGTTDCPSGTALIGFNAGTGYDQVTGLGSIDAFNLEQAMLGQTPPPAAKIATTTQVVASVYSVAPGASVTYTATISPAQAGAAPGGTVQFTDNGVPLGSPVTVASNQATTTTTYSSGGSHTIEAIYSGDSVYAGSTGVSGVITVTGAVASFSLSANPASVTIATLGNTQTATITASSSNGLNGTIYFSCSVASTGTSSPKNIPTCSIPGSVALSGNTTSGTATLTIATTANSGTIGTGGNTGGTAGMGMVLVWLAGGSGLVGCLFLLGGADRRRRIPALAGLALMGLVLTFAGCGGGGSSSSSTTTTTPTPPTSTGSGGTASGTYKVTVIGTGPTGSTAQTTSVTVTVP